jgi:hypothetical protein
MHGNCPFVPILPPDGSLQPKRLVILYSNFGNTFISVTVANPLSLVKIGEGVQLTIFEFFVEGPDKIAAKRVNMETSHESPLNQ